MRKLRPAELRLLQAMCRKCRDYRMTVPLFRDEWPPYVQSVTVRNCMDLGLVAIYQHHPAWLPLILTQAGYHALYEAGFAAGAKAAADDGVAR